MSAIAAAPPIEDQKPSAVPVSATSAVLPDDEGLLAAPESNLLVRRLAIANASDFDQLKEAARGLRTTAVSLHDAQAGPARASAVISNLADSLTRRSIELSIRELGPPPCPFSWIALGSHGRQEAVPGSDVDSALAWDSDEEDGDAKSYMLSLGSRVCEELARCGLAADKRGASAGGDLFVRPTGEWRRLIRELHQRSREGQGVDRDLALSGRSRPPSRRGRLRASR